MSTTDLRDIGELLDKYERQLTYVAKDATQSVVAAAQLERNQGGKLPVDTGFLRSSIAAALGTLPAGPVKGDPNKRYPAGTIGAQLIRWKPAQENIYVGWSAIYARRMEYRYGFLRSATQRWETFVNESTAKAQRLVK
jgi:hypothetical protein